MKDGAFLHVLISLFGFSLAPLAASHSPKSYNCAIVEFPPFPQFSNVFSVPPSTRDYRVWSSLSRLRRLMQRGTLLRASDTCLFLCRFAVNNFPIQTLELCLLSKLPTVPWLKSCHMNINSAPARAICWKLPCVSWFLSQNSNIMWFWGSYKHTKIETKRKNHTACFKTQGGSNWQYTWTSCQKIQPII